MGTAVVLCAMAVAMLIVAGARLRHLGGIVTVGALVATIAILAEPYIPARAPAGVPRPGAA